MAGATPPPDENPPPVDIAPVDFADTQQRAAIVKLLASYADSDAGGRLGMTPGARQRVADDLARRPGAVVLLAWRAGEPVGLAIAFEGYSTFAARPLLNLHDLVVAAEHRGRGVGGRLLEAVEGEARSRGCAFVTLEVVGSNRAAQRLYRRHGFVGGESISPPEAVMFFKKPLQ